MEMEDGEKVIGKVKKWFELITKARNLHPKVDTLGDNYAHTIFQELDFKESYYKGIQLKLLTCNQAHKGFFIS